MEIKETIKKYYINIEDKWFSLLDAIEDKVPIYKVIDPIEKNGVPSLLVFIVLILAISSLAFLSTSGSPYQINVTNQLGESIPVTITIFNSAFSREAPGDA